jgi:hypothetical protein
LLPTRPNFKSYTKKGSNNVHAVQKSPTDDINFPVMLSWITPSYVKPTMSSLEAWIGPPTYPSSAHSPPARDNSFTRSSEALLRYIALLTFCTRVQSDGRWTRSCAGINLLELINRCVGLGSAYTAVRIGMPSWPRLMNTKTRDVVVGREPSTSQRVACG